MLPYLQFLRIWSDLLKNSSAKSLLNLWVILVPNVFVRTGKFHMTPISCNFHRKNLKDCVTHIRGDTHMTFT